MTKYIHRNHEIHEKCKILNNNNNFIILMQYVQSVNNIHFLM